MLPVVFSQTAAVDGQGWVRQGHSVKYIPTNGDYHHRLTGMAPTRRGTSGNKPQGAFTLSFSLTFEHASDVCYIAYAEPYTYTDLQRCLHDLTAPCVQRTILCKSLAGNNCDLITITNPASTLSQLSKRSGVILTARVHPGESNASWVMQGILNFLISASPEAQALRDAYVFKIVPMLNPDGCINGNYRTSLAGVDLNRRWGKPDPVLHPTIYHTKKLMEVRSGVGGPLNLGIAVVLK